MVSMYDGRPNNDFVFSGRLEKLEEVDYQAGVKVEVAISAQITKSRLVQQSGAMLFPKPDRCPNKMFPESSPR